MHRTLVIGIPCTTCKANSAVNKQYDECDGSQYMLTICIGERLHILQEILIKSKIVKDAGHS